MEELRCELEGENSPDGVELELSSGFRRKDPCRLTPVKGRLAEKLEELKLFRL